MRKVTETVKRPIKTASSFPGMARLTGRTADAAAHVRRAASAHRRMARTRRAAKVALTTAKKTALAAGRALRAILVAAKGLVSAIAACGGVVLVIILVICLVGLLAASPFGLFFSSEDSGTGYTMPDAVTLLNSEFTNRIEQIKAINPHDILVMDNAGSAAMISNWDDVLAVYAVRTATNDASPNEVATLTEEKLSILREIFWSMNRISYWLEVIPGGEDMADIIVLHIAVSIKGHLQMADTYGFTRKQRALLLEMMAPEYQELFMVLTGSYRDIELSPEQIRDIVNKLPPSLSEERRQVVLTAYQLVGKVNYFWGGKSQVLGWDSRWGTPMEVWSEGSATTGSVRPFGLDCTGFIDWTLRNAGLPSDGHWYIGTNLTEVSWDEALPGDIALFPDASHVGIVVGRSVDGGILVCHCSYSQNNVVVTDCAATGFTAIGRPDVFG